jgi:hypothetical protein
MAIKGENNELKRSRQYAGFKKYQSNLLLRQTALAGNIVLEKN